MEMYTQQSPLIWIFGSKTSFLEILALDLFWFYILSWMIELLPDCGLRFSLAPLLHTSPCYHMVWTLSILSFFSVWSLSEPEANSEETRLMAPPPPLKHWWGLCWIRLLGLYKKKFCNWNALNLKKEPNERFIITFGLIHLTHGRPYCTLLSRVFHGLWESRKPGSLGSIW